MNEVRYRWKAPPEKKSIRRVRLRGEEADAEIVDSGRSGPLAGHERLSYHGVPPVKSAPFQLPHIPLYLWLGGIAAGSWLAVTAEVWSGEDDRDLVRAGRYLALASVLGGAGLLIVDLGRPDRFLNMLRVFRPRSPMSLGAWGLSTFGAYAGLAVLLQGAEDGWLGERPRLARLSGEAGGRVLHLIGLPSALFVGSYTGVLLSTTSTPSWAERSGDLSRLYVASATTSGLAAVSALLELTGGTRLAAASRLARAQVAALAAEGAFQLADDRRAKRLPSARDEPALQRVLRVGSLVAGIAVPLALNAVESRRARRGRGTAGDERGAGPGAGRRRSGRRLMAAGLALAGSLALRFTTVQQGERSARTPGDTWSYARRRQGAESGERPEEMHTESRSREQEKVHAHF